MKNRKSIIALLLVAIIGIVGLTVAYFSNSTSITNEFETSEYGTDVTETFTSPTGWQPGDETPKVLTVKNTGEVDEAVRIKVEEKWINKNGEEVMKPSLEKSKLIETYMKSGLSTDELMHLFDYCFEEEQKGNPYTKK